jgi:hypothetical protein
LLASGKDVLEEATVDGNLMIRARSHANLGHCTRRLGDRKAAIRHFTAALPLLRECGMTAEVVRYEWGLVLLDGVDDPEGALPVLERIRDEFLATARVADAAWVSLDTVDLLLDSGHPEEAGRLAADLYEFFSTRQLPYAAMVALGALRDAALDGGLTTKLIEEITARVTSAR